ncbi:MAG: helix-turn-helix transcriptional regulator [Oscillospiraceae bacterium]|nr:helix-turn-helix transcriptional regulator [Oscillospiraceae bacterium]
MERTIHIDSVDSFVCRETEPGFVFPGQVHHAPELIYVDQGQLHSVADGKDLVLEAGELVLYAPGQFHMQYADAGIAPRFLSIVFRIRGTDLAELTGRKIPAPQMVAEMLQLVRREWERGDRYSGSYVIAALELLILTLLRESAAPAPNARPVHAIHTENEVIRQAQQYVSTHVREKLSVPLVARKADVSPSYLTALFHKHLGISPGDYIRRVKLQESKELIREGSMNFTEIAAALNYSTVHHFSRQFKDKFGITPTEYAKSIK